MPRAGIDSEMVLTGHDMLIENLACFVELTSHVSDSSALLTKAGILRLLLLHGLHHGLLQILELLVQVVIDFLGFALGVLAHLIPLLREHPHLLLAVF